MSEEETTSPITDKGEDPVVTRKSKPSAKELAMSLVMRRFPGKGKSKDDWKPYPIKKPMDVNSQHWRPIDNYALDKGWKLQMDRLSGIRDSPIITPFGKKVSWDEMRAEASKQIKTIKDNQLKKVEEKKLRDEYVPVRGMFLPLMHLGRIVLQDPYFYEGKIAPKWTYEIPKFTPIPSLDKVEYSKPAQRANMGFPWNERLAEAGQEWKSSPNYHKLIIAAKSWEKDVLVLPKLSPEAIHSISPPNAVFERAQSEGRDVVAQSKKTATSSMRFQQPLQAEVEKDPCVMSGDRVEIRESMLKLLRGEISEVAKGDDLAVRLKNGTILAADASGFDTGVSAESNKEFVKQVEDKVPTSKDKTIFKAANMSEYVESATLVGYVQLLMWWGVVSGSPFTSIKGTMESLNRSRGSKRKDVKTCLHDLEKYGYYTTEAVTRGACLMLQLWVDNRRPEYIHGFQARMALSLVQREDPVLTKKVGDYWIDEEARLVQILGNLFGYEGDIHSKWCKFVKTRFEFRQSRTKLEEKAREKMSKSSYYSVTSKPNDEKYEREGIKATLDLVL
jgi:transcription antitermination factor NusG